MPLPYPPGARLLGRPDTVTPCSACGDPAGRGYPDCPDCQERVDAYWRADWSALLEGEGIAEGGPEERELAGLVLQDPSGTHPWTCTDWALRLLVCPDCRAELGAGTVDCLTCVKADQARWAWDHGAPRAAMSPNEHALRLAVVCLRSAERRRESVVGFWRLSLPFLLVGQTAGRAQARRIRTHLLAGRDEELAEADGIAAMAALPDLPWRAGD